MGEQIESLLDRNGDFIVWWQSKLDAWANLRTRGLLGWVLWECSWLLLIPITIAFYAYLALTIVVGWGLRLWYLSIPLIVFAAVVALHLNLI